VLRLRAASEDTRLRVLALLAQGELSVSDLTEILSQSQPRISRHLKVLVEAGLVERHREGAWAFFRLGEGDQSSDVARAILALIDPADDQLRQDRERLVAARARRASTAESYFARIAPQWDSLRSLHVAETAVEAAISEVVGVSRLGAVIDLGTGTGRILQLLATQAERAVGLDASHAMLSVARSNLGKAGLTRVELRQGDIYAPPFAADTFDLAVVHQVLHYLDDPGRAIAQAARLVRPGGRLLVVDFAPHKLEALREHQAHRRLGFSSDQIAGWMGEVGLACTAVRELSRERNAGEGLTVTIWLGVDQRAPAAKNPVLPARREYA
jgi:ArsR family transcriptional regulator